MLLEHHHYALIIVMKFCYYYNIMCSDIVTMALLSVSILTQELTAVSEKWQDIGEEFGLEQSSLRPYISLSLYMKFCYYYNIMCSDIVTMALFQIC